MNKMTTMSNTMSDLPTTTTTSIELNTTTITDLYNNNSDDDVKRLPAWMTLAVFSTVCLAAETSGGNHIMKNNAGIYVLIITTLSILISFISVACYILLRSIYVTQLPEFILLFLVAILWCINIPMIMNPKDEIAILPEDVSDNANLFFFSWFCFGIVGYIGFHLAYEGAGIDLFKTPSRVLRWYLLAFTSLIVMGTSVRVYDSANCGSSETDGWAYCKRAKLAISIGVISCVFSAAMTGWVTIQQHALTPITEFLVCCTLMLLWCIGIGFITFGDTPGEVISNLYFASWISFIITTLLFGETISDYYGIEMGSHIATITAETAAPMSSSRGSSQQQQQQHVIPSPTNTELSLEEQQ